MSGATGGNGLSPRPARPARWPEYQGSARCGPGDERSILPVGVPPGTSPWPSAWTRSPDQTRRARLKPQPPVPRRPDPPQSCGFARTSAGPEPAGSGGDARCRTGAATRPRCSAHWPARRPRWPRCSTAGLLPCSRPAHGLGPPEGIRRRGWTLFPHSTWPTGTIAIWLSLSVGHGITGEVLDRAGDDLGLWLIRGFELFQDCQLVGGVDDALRFRR